MRKALLAMTPADHRIIGSTPPEALAEGQILAKSMRNAKLRSHLRRQVQALGELHARALAKTSTRADRRIFFEARDEILTANLNYLREIGRLPPEYDFNPKERFPY